MGDHFSCGDGSRERRRREWISEEEKQRTRIAELEAGRREPVRRGVLLTRLLRYLTWRLLTRVTDAWLGAWQRVREEMREGERE